MSDETESIIQRLTEARRSMSGTSPADLAAESRLRTSAQQRLLDLEQEDTSGSLGEAFAHALVTALPLLVAGKTPNIGESAKLGYSAFGSAKKENRDRGHERGVKLADIELEEAKELRKSRLEEEREVGKDVRAGILGQVRDEQFGEKLGLQRDINEAKNLATNLRLEILQADLNRKIKEGEFKEVAAKERLGLENRRVGALEEQQDLNEEVARSRTEIEREKLAWQKHKEKSRLEIDTIYKMARVDSLKSGSDLARQKESRLEKEGEKKFDLRKEELGLKERGLGLKEESQEFLRDWYDFQKSMGKEKLSLEKEKFAQSSDLEAFEAKEEAKAKIQAKYQAGRSLSEADLVNKAFNGDPNDLRAYLMSKAAKSGQATSLQPPDDEFAKWVEQKTGVRPSTIGMATALLDAEKQENIDSRQKNRLKAEISTRMNKEALALYDKPVGFSWAEGRTPDRELSQEVSGSVAKYLIMEKLINEVSNIVEEEGTFIAPLDPDAGAKRARVAQIQANLSGIVASLSPYAKGNPSVYETKKFLEPQGAGLGTIFDQITSWDRTVLSRLQGMKKDAKNLIVSSATANGLIMNYFPTQVQLQKMGAATEQAIFDRYQRLYDPSLLPSPLEEFEVENLEPGQELHLGGKKYRALGNGQFVEE